MARSPCAKVVTKNTLNAADVALVNPVLAAVSVRPVPWAVCVSVEKVATPATAFTLTGLPL